MRWLGRGSVSSVSAAVSGMKQPRFRMSGSAMLMELELKVAKRNDCSLAN